MKFTRTTKAAFAGVQGLEVLAGAVLPLTAGGKFTARMNSVRAAHLVVTYGAVSPCRISKAGPDAERGQLQMIFPLDSPVDIEDQIPRTVEPGGMVIGTALSLPSLRIELAGRAMIVSILPGSRPRTMFWPPQNMYFTSPPSSNVAVLKTAADALYRSPRSDARTIGLLTQICSTVVTDSYLDSKPANAAGALAARAHKFISDGFKGADCTPQEIASQMGVSLRSLQEAFWREGGVATAIRAHRTEEALRLLGSSGLKLNLDSIARHSGFKDAGAMRRAITKDIGVPPSSYRRHFG